MAVFKCKMCGGDLNIAEGQTIVICDYCGTNQTLPKLTDERRALMYDRANHSRRNNEFDKAMSIYEQILSEDNTDAEAYWSLVLCRYGIEYVEEPISHKRKPTVNRAQFTSIFNDNDYKSAIKYADVYQRTIYQEEASVIDNIQKEILKISESEKPFDVFICYKETGADGRRTLDSVRAMELYNELTKEGYKVFFSRVTLEDKLGTAYEPYIFAALNSAKVMVVIGTCPEHFNAVWVKNEWSRYLALIKSGAKKSLIPAYENMDAYDLPEEFSYLQSQNMSKIGAMQDLIHGIKKLVGKEEPKAVVKETAYITNNGVNISSLIKRAFLAIEDGHFDEANNHCEKVLDNDPECAEAYFCKLLIHFNISDKNQLYYLKTPLSTCEHYSKCLRFGNDKLKEYLQTTNNEIIYRISQSLMDNANTEDEYINASNSFLKITGYKDSDNKANECIELGKKATFDSYVMQMESAKTEEELLKVANLFEGISSYQNADILHDECIERGKKATYDSYVKQMNSASTEDEYNSIANRFDMRSGYRDSERLAYECREKAEVLRKIRIYSEASRDMSNNSLLGYKSAIEKFRSIRDFEDSSEMIDKCIVGIDTLHRNEEKKRQEEQMRTRQQEEENRRQQMKEMAKKRNKNIFAVIQILLAIATIPICILFAYHNKGILLLFFLYLPSLLCSVIGLVKKTFATGWCRWIGIIYIIPIVIAEIIDGANIPSILFLIILSAIIMTIIYKVSRILEDIFY